MKSSIFVSAVSLCPIYYHTYQKEHKDWTTNLITTSNSTAEDEPLFNLWT